MNSCIRRKRGRRGSWRRKKLRPRKESRRRKLNKEWIWSFMKKRGDPSRTSVTGRWMVDLCSCTKCGCWPIAVSFWRFVLQELLLKRNRGFTSFILNGTLMLYTSLTWSEFSHRQSPVEMENSFSKERKSWELTSLDGLPLMRLLSTHLLGWGTTQSILKVVETTWPTSSTRTMKGFQDSTRSCWWCSCQGQGLLWTTSNCCSKPWNFPWRNKTSQSHFSLWLLSYMWLVASGTVRPLVISRPTQTGWQPTSFKTQVCWKNMLQVSTGQQSHARLLVTAIFFQQMAMSFFGQCASSWSVSLSSHTSWVRWLHNSAKFLVHRPTIRSELTRSTNWIKSSKSESAWLTK